MIRDLLDPVYINQQKDYLLRMLEVEIPRLESGNPTSLETAANTEVTADDLRDALQWLRSSSAVDTARQDLVYIPSDAPLSVLQSCLDYSFMRSGLVVDPKISKVAEDSSAFEPVTSLHLPPSLVSPPEVDRVVPFEEGDLRYGAGYALARAASALRRKPSFVDRPARAEIDEQARIVLMGDWGCGIERAQMLAKSVAKVLAKAPERQGHVIHLGDVYFAGLDYEYTDRVIPFWPGAVDRSWTISGNHDMYSGGGPFFERMLGSALFTRQSKSSWFVLENEDWQICGLDSSFQPPDALGMRGDFAGTQAAQVHEIRRTARKKGGILLTHHQPFNVVDGVRDIHSPNMVDKLEPAIGEKLFRAWFWGHEHSCAVYQPWRTIEYPCLTGNAGVPALFRYPLPDPLLRWRWDDAISTPDGKYATLGFAVLDLTGDSMEVSFYNEYGHLRKQDERHIVRSQAAS